MYAEGRGDSIMYSTIARPESRSTTSGAHIPVQARKHDSVCAAKGGKRPRASPQAPARQTKTAQGYGSAGLRLLERQLDLRRARRRRGHLVFVLVHRHHRRARRERRRSMGAGKPERGPWA
ncbi:hypothetical protein GSI_06121 [Ganoderma sinense ZZ0214-1]|uniref:Uncharacterized protein n=1 Tax=Ganoderma sinense ZZ0214-1 TaxID=1077348 RepID=A0A2G8SCD0_9APHY|nr:hypothetical protein GSI_06121 [Ganoderma sinense ZZ0214-1]